MVVNIDELEKELVISRPHDDRLSTDGGRRATGPGLLWEKPGAIIDIFIENIDKGQVVSQWREDAQRVLSAIGWSNEQIISRVFEEGVNLAISAPMDLLSKPSLTEPPRCEMVGPLQYFCR